MAYADEYRSAQQVLTANGGDHEAELARQEALVAEAEAAGVTRSEYIGYEEAFANYEARSDIEPLAERRAREIGYDATAAQFRREGEGSAAVFTSPGDGNVGGLTTTETTTDPGADGIVGTADDGATTTTEVPLDTPGDETDPEGPTP